jgi:hypothetical protein
MRLRGFIIGGAILSILVGFLVGKTVDAGAPEPGSSADPVVSKSYVDQALEERVGELELEVAEITVQAQALQTTINELQDKLNKAGGIKTTPTSSSNTTPSTSTGTSTGSTGSTSETSGASIGKTVYVKASNNYVNLRSGPSTDTNTIKQVQKGEAMKIFEIKDQWYHVELDDKTVGWVANWVVDVK